MMIAEISTEHINMLITYTKIVCMVQIWLNKKHLKETRGKLNSAKPCKQLERISYDFPKALIRGTH